MANRDIVVIGGSAGAITALQTLVKGLPKDFNAAIFVVVHLSPDSPNVLPHILGRAGKLPAANARHGETIEPGRIYVAPPDHHLLVQSPGQIHISYGPKENRFRPAVDPLFRSAALAFGPRVVGVVLSGGLDDGTAGLLAIKQAGGIALVQDPEEAEAPSMPASALRHVEVDRTLKVGQIPACLTKLVSEPIEPLSAIATRPAMPKQLEIEVKVQSVENNRETAIRDLGEPSLFTCPECHGTLIQIRHGQPVRFRCHTGHAYTSATLETELGGKIEDALWITIRSLEEHAMLLNHMADNGTADGGEPARLRSRAKHSLHRSNVIRKALSDEGTGATN